MSDTKPTPAKIERAVAKANAPVPGSRVDSRWALDFLRALEAEGLKLMDGEVRVGMYDAAWKNIMTDEHKALRQKLSMHEVRGLISASLRCGIAAVPTLADRLKEEE